MKDLNLTYDDIKDMDDDAFDELFTKKSEEVILKRGPDCKYIDEELRRKGVTLMLLWEEYVEECIVNVNNKTTKRSADKKLNHIILILYFACTGVD